ncbi:MAG: hypothetical protein HY774_05325 [Acidobacteria bacterium]|nr:hypothetical protein [Acidobacteriota bacterium]
MKRFSPMSVTTRKRCHRICPNCQIKVCTQCEQAKPPADFYPDKRAIDGLQVECKTCRADRQREYLARRRIPRGVPKKPNPPNFQPRRCPVCDYKVCTHCREAKPVSEFTREPTSLDGFDFRCRDCARQQAAELARDWRATNRDQHQETRRRYAATHKEAEAAHNKRSYEAHREARLAYRKRYRETHKEEIAAAQKRYRETHKEEIAAYHRHYYQEHQEQAIAAQKRYRQIHKEQVVATEKPSDEAHKE